MSRNREMASAIAQEALSQDLLAKGFASLVRPAQL